MRRPIALAVLVALAALARASALASTAAAPTTFFITSRAVPQGGRLGGLAGADRVCQDLAVAAGAGGRTWHAYLSTAFRKAPALNAGDRIGAGPWHNAAGALVATRPADLHRGTVFPAALFLTESGQPVAAGTRILTGSRANGLAAIEQTCENWTSSAGETVAGEVGGSWNSGTVVRCDGSGPPLRLACFAAP
ncbi:MAG: hypothetical protein U0P30_15935 [Vicinamibacterales bacterium]